VQRDCRSRAGEQSICKPQAGQLLIHYLKSATVRGDKVLFLVMSESRDFLVRDYYRSVWGEIRTAAYIALAIVAVNGLVIRPWQRSTLVIPGKTPPAIEYIVNTQWDVFWLWGDAAALGGSMFLRRRKFLRDLEQDEQLDRLLMEEPERRADSDSNKPAS
jgi:hypothetical protein